MAVEATGYSIWIEPKSIFQEKYNLLIEALAARFNSPVFDAHVTLVGGIQEDETNIVDKLASISNMIQPFDLSLTSEVICEDHWTKSLAVRADLSPRLVTANNLARKIYNLESQPPYCPHMSFLYAEGLLAQSRLEAARDTLLPSFNTSFNADELHLYRCEGSVTDWKKIATHSLRTSV